MAIKFRCPQCGTPYQVRDEMAGQKAPCKREGCGKILRIPKSSSNGTHQKIKAPTAQTVSTPEVDADADALAASLLTDEPPKIEEKVEGKPIPIVCNSCDHEFEVPAEKAGKNVICPECTERIRVPEPKVEKPKDWREVDQRNPLLKKTDEPADVWDTTQKTGPARESLKEAGALIGEDEYEPVPISRRLTQVFLMLALVSGLVFGGIYGYQWWGKTAQITQMNEAIVAVETAEQEGSPLPPSWVAVVHTQAGAYDLHFATDLETRRTAENHFTTARGKYIPRASGPDQDYLIIDLALAQLGLGGTPEQISDDARLSWTEVQGELRRTLSGLSRDSDVRDQAFRQLAMRLAGTGEVEVIAAVAGMVAESRAADVIGLAGVVLYQNGYEDEARTLLQRGEERFKQTTPPPSVPWLQALAMALGEKARYIPPPGSAEPSPATRLGYAVGYALSGDLDRAMKLAERGGSAAEPRLRTALSLAGTILDQHPDQGEKLLDLAEQILTRDLRRQRISEWLSYRLVELNAQAGRIEQANNVAETMRDKKLRGWAYLAIVRSRLAGLNERRDLKILKDLGEEDELARAVGMLELARHNARVAGTGAVESELTSWEPKFRPFGYIALAWAMRPE